MLVLCVAALQLSARGQPRDAKLLPTSAYEVPIDAEVGRAPKEAPTRVPEQARLRKGEPEGARARFRDDRAGRSAFLPTASYEEPVEAEHPAEPLAKPAVQSISVGAGADMAVETKVRQRSSRTAAALPDRELFREEKDSTVSTQGALIGGERAPEDGAANASLAELQAVQGQPDPPQAAQQPEVSVSATADAAGAVNLDHLMGVSAHDASHEASVEHIAGFTLETAAEAARPAAEVHQPHHEDALSSGIHDAAAESPQIAALVEHAAAAAAAVVDLEPAAAEAELEPAAAAGLEPEAAEGRAPEAAEASAASMAAAPAASMAQLEPAAEAEEEPYAEEETFFVNEDVPVVASMA